MKNTICIIFISLLLCGTVTASSISYHKSTMLVDELDQSQIQFNWNALFIGRYNTTKRQAAQSFIPQKGILTRVEIYLSRLEYLPASQPFFLAVRETLTGPTLTEISINPSSVPLYDFAWKQFDFPDIPVVTGKTYYLVGYSSDIASNGFYLWGGIDTNPYVNGNSYMSENNGVTWILQQPDLDLCFKTYGLLNDPPDKPSITGTIKGQPTVLYNYTFTAIEPDGENIKYVIDWDDGNQEETAYVGTGESITVSHTWADRGRYTIKAKAVDINGKESEWGTLNIQMPKAYEVNFRWEWFQHQFPFLARILNFVFFT